MSIIKVNCPSCRSPLKIAEQKLRETQGRVVCHECQHIFRLVKKSKTAPKQQPAAPKPDFPVFDEVGSIRDVKETPKAAEPVWPTDGWPSENAGKASSEPSGGGVSGSRKKAAHKPQKRLSYRIPKAEVKTAFAEVNQQAPIAFNLLDPQSANKQVPQVSINPPVNAVEAAQQALQQGSDQQNNITIHTGSLVFTLVGDSQGSTTTLTAPDGSKFADPSVQGVQTTMVQVPSASSEMNWTVATISLLIVLIIQLFYIIWMPV